MKIGIIGATDIGEQMVKVFLKNRVVTSSEVSVYDTDSQLLNAWAGKYDIFPCQELEEVVKSCQFLFITEVGKKYPKLLSAIDYMLRTYRPLVVSMARGKSLEEIENMMDFIPPMARIATNLNIGVGLGITAYCFNELVTGEQKEILIEMFSSTGKIVEIDEIHMDAFTAVSYLSSSFTCALANTLVSCGMLDGLSKDVALRTTLQSIAGTTKMLLDGAVDISELEHKLCPTESMALEATLSLRENGFDKAVIKGYRVSELNSN